MKYGWPLVMLLLSPLCRAGVDDCYVKRAAWPDTMTATRQEVVKATAEASEPLTVDRGLEVLCRRLWDDFPEMDWFLQDNPYRDPETSRVDLRREFAWYFAPHRDAGAEQQMIRRVLAELPDPSELLGRLQSLIERSASPADPAWWELYAEACRWRRQIRLEPLLRRAPQLVFTKHYTLGGSHYAYTEGQSDAQDERHFVPGTALCLLRYDGTSVHIKTLIDDPQGVIRDPDVSYDGGRVLFAWKKSDVDDDYHLYELDLSTREVRQLTEGLGAADYEAAYLPDGDILFNSTRCVQTVDCWWTEVSNLYRCDRDGASLRRLTFDQVHDNYPTITDDQRVLYTRWEYNDRGQIYPQPLLQMCADGTNQSDFYGGNSWFPTTILHARGIPGTQKVVAVASGHHSRQTGKLILIDPRRGRQENEGVTLIAPVRHTPAVKIDAYGQEGELFQYPYPLSETEFLVTYHPIGWSWADGYGVPTGIYFLAIDGRRELLARDPKLPCSQPVPVQARPIRQQRASKVDERQSEGTCYVQDVYVGPGLAGVPRGVVKTLRVVSLDFRAAGIGENGNGGPGGAALVSTPIAIGNGAWDAKIILGDAQVHADGSAAFRLPARTPVYFQLLDARGRCVQTMRSWTTLQPGENASCVGCHEHKNSAPDTRRSLPRAIELGPQRLRPFYGEPRGFSFPSEIQPILNRRCVSCHSGPAGDAPPLTARVIQDPVAKRNWSEAYLYLTHAQPEAKGRRAGAWRGDAEHPLVNWVSAQSAPPLLPPYSAGSARSRLLEILDQGHEDVKLSQEELDKLAAWIDLGVPFCGDYLEAHAWTVAELKKYEHYARKRERLAGKEAASRRGE